MRDLTLAICFLILMSNTTEAQTTVGYVLEVSGSWVLNGSNTLSQGERLPAAGSIRLTTRSRSSRIVIANLRGEILTSRNCAVDNCSSAIILPRGPKPSSTWNAVFATAMELIWGAPDKYSAHRSRSGDISDGVLKIVDGKVDFAPVLISQGEQYFRWHRVSNSTDEKPLGSLPVRLPNPPVVSSPDLQPGLYSFDLLRRVGDNFETVSSARILITSEDKFEKTRNSFQEAVELTEKWGTSVKPETARLYLQTRLVELARESER